MTDVLPGLVRDFRRFPNLVVVGVVRGALLQSSRAPRERHASEGVVFRRRGVPFAVGRFHGVSEGVVFDGFQDFARPGSDFFRRDEQSAGVGEFRPTTDRIRRFGQPSEQVVFHGRDYVRAPASLGEDDVFHYGLYEASFGIVFVPRRGPVGRDGFRHELVGRARAVFERRDDVGQIVVRRAGVFFFALFGAVAAGVVLPNGSAAHWPDFFKKPPNGIVFECGPRASASQEVVRGSRKNVPHAVERIFGLHSALVGRYGLRHPRSYRRTGSDRFRRVVGMHVGGFVREAAASVSEPLRRHAVVRAVFVADVFLSLRIREREEVVVVGIVGSASRIRERHRFLRLRSVVDRYGGEVVRRPRSRRAVEVFERRAPSERVGHFRYAAVLSVRVGHGSSERVGDGREAALRVVCQIEAVSVRVFDAGEHSLGVELLLASVFERHFERAVGVLHERGFESLQVLVPVAERLEGEVLKSAVDVRHPAVFVRH